MFNFSLLNRSVLWVVFCGAQLLSFAYGLDSIYQCEMPDGRILYQDSPCESGVQIAAFEQPKVNVGESKTESGKAGRSLAKQKREEVARAREIRKQERDLAKQKQAYERQKSQKARQIARAEKKSLADREHAKRQKVRCQQIEDKIHWLQKQLRLGCKEKQFQRIKAQIEYYEILKKRYCTN